VVDRPIAPGASSESFAPLGYRGFRELFLFLPGAGPEVNPGRMPITTVMVGTLALGALDLDTNADALQTIQQLMNDIFVWIGFGTVVGLLAKAIMPGRDPGGAIATLAMGVGGTVIGCGILSFLVEGQRVTPVSPMGFAVGTGGAFIILAFYRLLAGYWFVEGEHPRARLRPATRRRRRYSAAAYDDD